MVDRLFDDVVLWLLAILSAAVGRVLPSFFSFLFDVFFLLVFIESYRWPQRRRGTPRSEPKPALVIGAGGPLVAISTTTTTKRAKGFHS